MKIYSERKKAYENEYLLNCLPFDINGQVKIPSISEKEYVEKYRNFNSVKKEQLNRVLTNLFKKAKLMLIDYKNNS